MRKALLSACIALASCGGSSGPSLGPETAPTAAQQAGIESVERGLALLAAADTQGSATGGAALLIASSSWTLLAPRTAAASAAPLASEVSALLDGTAQADCAVVGPNSVVWHQCTEGSTTIDGSVSWSPGHVEIDLHMTGTTGTGSFDYAMAGALTVTATTIESDFAVSIRASAGNTTVNAMSHSAIDVQRAAGCITGGTMTTTVSGTNGAASGAVQVVWTGCHAFRVRNG